MSILAAIIQAIFQAVTYILPLSETGHSAMFHDFAGRFDSSASAITGIIHIGIAIGIIIATYKLFLSMLTEFFGVFGDLFKKRLTTVPPKPARKFMYYTLLSFVPMILWLIPLGEKGFLFTFLKNSGYNKTLLDDGIFFLITGAIVLLCIRQLKLSNNNKNVNLIYSLIIGFASVILVPVSGLSFLFGVFAILMLLGVTRKISLRYSFVMNVPVLIVMGFIEIFTSSEAANIIAAIIGFILSAAVSFLCVKILKWIIKNEKLKYFAYYDLSVGALAIIIGIFELILR
ncbi:MAG: undecaprenyl-diphosphate phosphatase [Eubacterium sp.]|nr:undecaprenyl-diphosphate phosphatase [Eubacterium sp.]